MIDLEHVTGECVGNWRLHGSTGHQIIRCDRCAATHAATPENRLVAIDENYAGIYLRRLTSEGFKALEQEKRDNDERKAA